MGGSDKYYTTPLNTTLICGVGGTAPTLGAPPGYVGVVSPVLVALPFFEVAKNSTLTFTATVSAGSDVIYFKECGPDFMTVDPETGEVSWDTTYLPRGQAFALTIGASNSGGTDYAHSVIHVDNLAGASKLRVAGTYQADLGGTLSPYIRIASQEINAGDTLIIPDGTYYASVTGSGQGNRENVFSSEIQGWDAGTDAQMTSVAGASPDGVVVTGAAHDALTRAQSGINTDGSQGFPIGDYAKVINIEYTQFREQAVLSDSGLLILDNVGATDSAYYRTPTSYAEASAAYASLASAYLQGDYSVFDSCYAYGQFRYGLQFGNPIANNIMMRNIVRPDDYHGNEPRAGIATYSTAELGVFNNFVIDGDQEDFAPFYEYSGGCYSAPATGNESYPTGMDFDANVAMNTQLMPAAFDARTSDDNTLLDNFVAWNTVSTLTPEVGERTPLILRSNDTLAVGRASFGKIKSWDLTVQSESSGSIRCGQTDQAISMTGIIFYKVGWDGVSTVVDAGPLLAGTSGNAPSTLTGYNLYDFVGVVDPGGNRNWTATVETTTDPTLNGWDYIVRVEDGSPLDAANQGAMIEEFKSPKGFLHGDAGWDTPTGEWCWPIPGEDHVRLKAKAYSKTSIPTRASTPGGVDFGTGNLSGDRGGCADDESFSEYMWGQLGRTVPPLRSFIKPGVGEFKAAVGKYKTTRWDTITKFKIYNDTDRVNSIGTITTAGSLWTTVSLGAGTYDLYITAVDPTKATAWNGNETGESGRGELHTVTIT